MANNVEIIITAVNKAKAELGNVEKQLGGISTTADKTGTSMGGVGKKTQLAMLAAGAAVTAFAVSFAKDSILLTARADTLAVVTETMGKNLGFTADEVRGYEESIQSMGITTVASREAVAQLMRSNIDLSKSTDLARLAQDAAVIAGDNSSESFAALSYIISTGNTLMARRRGLMVDFPKAYKDMAESLDKVVDELTDAERAEARLNEVLKQGINIAGTYEAAMETAGKKLSSFPRHWEELKVAFGRKFQPAFADGIDIVTDFVDSVTDAITVENQLMEALDRGIITKDEYRDVMGRLHSVYMDTTEDAEWLTAALEEQDDKFVDITASVGSFDRAILGLPTDMPIIEEMDEASEAANELVSSFGGLLSVTREVKGATESFAEKQDNLKESNLELKAEIQSLTVDGYAENKDEIDRLNEKLEENRLAMIENKDEFTEATNVRILNRAEEILSADGLTVAEEKALLDRGLAMGIYTQKFVNQANKIISESARIASNVTSNLANIPDETVRITFDVMTMPVVKLTGAGAGIPRASGGPVTAGAAYVVGERGPELFVSKESGTIVPNNQLEGSQGGKSLIIENVNINNGMDLYEFQSMLRSTLNG